MTLINSSSDSILSAGQNDTLTTGKEFVDIRRRSLPFVTADKLLTAIQNTSSDDRRHLTPLIVKMLETLDAYSFARHQFDEEDPRWLITALQATDNNITQWIAAQDIQGKLDEQHRLTAHKDRTERNRLRERMQDRLLTIRQMLGLYREACLYLLEGSAYLRDCTTTQERVTLQSRLSVLAENANYHDAALQSIAAGEHEQFIATLLDNMKKSGFVYHPHKQFQILMIIFKICPKLINERMGDIFDVIQGWERGNWQNEPFRGAFVEMLEMFINDTRNRIDELAGLEAKNDNDSFTMVIQALAIQLLLATESDHVDRNRNQAMLVRYLMMLPAVNRDNLAERVFATLCGVPPRTLEFQWPEINQVTLLGHRLGADATVWPGTFTPRRYVGKQAQVVIDHDGLRIEPLGNSTLTHPVLPGDLLPWHNMQVKLYDEIATPTRNKLRDVARLSKMWAEIEDSLFDTTPGTVQHQMRKVEPEIGDRVHVIIDDTDVSDDYVLHCTIVDDQFEGEGWLHARDIVQWFNIDMSLDYFRDRATGKPLVFEVSVSARNRYGDLQFRMAEQVTDYIWNSVNHGDEFDAVIANVVASNKQYTCLSREGFSFWVNAEGEFDSLKRSTFVRLRVTEVRSGNAMYAEAVKILDDMHRFPHDEPFSNLMQQLGVPGDVEGDTPGDEAENFEPLPPETLREVVLLVRRVSGNMPDDYVGTYNYLSMARLLARVADEQRQVELCTCHLRLLELLARYDAQESLSTDTVEQYSQMASVSPVLQRLYNMLWLVSCIDNPQTADRVWSMTSTGNQTEALMARMVLSLNMLGNETVKEQRNAIKARIKAMLRMSNYDDQSAKYYGSESLHTEFKTSITTPPDTGMRRDIDTQTRNIMRVVCGFLNADGGKLYLGVRDNGIENGLDQDMLYFKTRDKLDLHVRNSVHDLLGATANNFVNGVWDDEAKHDVYILEIMPCPHLIKLQDVVWVRQGTSTRPLEGEDLENYRVDRQQLFAQQNKVVAPTPIEDTPPTIEKPIAPSALRPEEIVAVSTCRHRNNVLHDYEEGYVADTIGYVYFKPNNKFEYSPTDIYIEHESQLAIVIHDNEQQGFMVMVYDNGDVVRVPMREILDKTPGQSYNYGNGERLVFAAPLMSDQALLLIMRDGKNNYVYRVALAGDLDQNSINNTGERLFDMPFNDILACEVVNAQCIDKFSDGMNLSARQVGYNIKRGNLSFDEAIEHLIAQAGEA